MKLDDLKREMRYHLEREGAIIKLCNADRNNILDDLECKNDIDIDGTIKHLDRYINHLGDLAYHVRRIREVAESVRVMANDAGASP